MRSSLWAGLRRPAIIALILLLCLFSGTDAFAHAVTQGDKGYIQEISGVHLLPFTYLGAKHMMTGYDHILFLFGVIFFSYKLSHIALVALPSEHSGDHTGLRRVMGLTEMGEIKTRLAKDAAATASGTVVLRTGGDYSDIKRMK
jgi:hypothetical protein